MVEHRTAGPVVIGSNPIVPFFSKEKERNIYIYRLRSSEVKYLLRVQVARVRFPAEPYVWCMFWSGKSEVKNKEEVSNVYS